MPKNNECHEEDEDKTEIAHPRYDMVPPELRTLFILGEVNANTVAMFLSVFTIMDSTKGDITVRICSGGGDVGAGFAIYDLLRSSKNKIITEGFGTVHSIATVLLQAGDVRRLSENCRFMAHSVSAMVPYPMGASHMAGEAAEASRLNTAIVDILKKRSKLSLKDCQRILREDVFFSAKQAKAIGLCDEIIKNKRWTK